MGEQLHGKVVVVTGSSSGLGEAIAILFASRGSKVTLCGCNDNRLKSVFDKAVKASGGHQDKFLTVQADLKDDKGRKKIISKTVDKFGRLDILVANAGIIHMNESILDVTEEMYDDIMDSNLKSVFFLIQKAVPHLEKSKGNIINISSATTNMAIPNLTITLMSKVALDHLTRCLAVDLGAKGIRVNSVNPGYFPTRILRQIDTDTEKLNGQFGNLEIDKQALKGRKGTVDDIAEAVLFLASDRAGFVTGEHIKVNGGRSFGGPF